MVPRFQSDIARLLLGIGLLIIVGGSSRGGERTEESFIPRYAVASGYFLWSDDADFSNRTGSVSHWESGVEVNAPILTRPGFRLTAGARYRRNQFDFSSAPLPLNSTRLDLTRVDLPLNAWIDLNDRWKVWARLQPGIYSDFGSVDGDDFILTSLVLFSYRWSETTKLAFGGFYSRDLGEERLLPAIGLIYEPNPQWSLALTFPRLELAYAPNRDWFVTGRVVLGGGGWNIDDPSGANRDLDFNYRAIRASLGIDRRLGSSPWWVYFDAGAQFAQEIEIEALQFAEDLESNAYLQSGVRLRF